MSIFQLPPGDVLDYLVLPLASISFELACLGQFLYTFISQGGWIAGVNEARTAFTAYIIQLCVGVLGV